MEKQASKLNFTKVTLLLVSTLTVMSGATISPSLPGIRDVFSDVPNAEMLSRLVLTIPALFIAICAPLAGIITDKYGRKPLLLICLVLYGIAGSSGLYLDSLISILVGRALLGVSVAGIMTVAVTLIGDYFDGQERSSFMGYQAAFMGLGGAIFISGGGFLADIDWRWPFAIYLFALLLLPLVWKHIAEPEKIVSEESSSLTFSMKGNMDFPKITIGIVFLAIVANMIMFYMVPVQIPFYLSEDIGVNNTLAGIAISVMTFSSALTSLFYRRLKTKLTFNQIYALVFLFMGTGFLVIWQGLTYALTIVGLLISGIGAGLFLPNANLHIMELAPLRLRGRLVSGITSAMFLGQFLSPLAVQPVMNAYSLISAFMFAGFLMLLFSVGFLLWRQKPKVRPKVVTKENQA